MIIRNFCVSMVATVLGSNLAACPVEADMSLGVSLTFSDGLVEVYRTAADNRVVVEGRDGTVVTHRLDLLHGLYLERYVGVEDGVEVVTTNSIYRYPQGDDAPQPPVIGAVWAGDVSRDDAGEVSVERQEHSIDFPTELVIGDCAYVNLPVTIVYGADGVYREIVNYLPELGLGYLAAYANNGGDLNEQTVTAIEVIDE